MARPRGLSGKHRKTLTAVFDEPTPSGIPWRDIEALFLALGGRISEGRGSRVRVALGDVWAVFHRPHPHKETDRGAVRSVRDFLTNAGFSP